jgi:membrane dipeptidase
VLLQATVVDVERIHKSGKLVAVSCIENGYVIGRDLSLIERHQKFGACYITWAHGGHNDISDSAMPSTRSISHPWTWNRSSYAMPSAGELT